MSVAHLTIDPLDRPIDQLAGHLAGRDAVAILQRVEVEQLAVDAEPVAAGLFERERVVTALRGKGNAHQNHFPIARNDTACVAPDE